MGRLSWERMILRLYKHCMENLVNLDQNQETHLLVEDLVEMGQEGDQEDQEDQEDRGDQGDLEVLEDLHLAQAVFLLFILLMVSQMSLDLHFMEDLHHKEDPLSEFLHPMLVLHLFIQVRKVP